MFDLNRQIQAWRSSLSQAPSVRGQDVDELEGHLREGVTKLRETGLSDEEAFWVTSRRIGPLDGLATEFGKINGELAGWRRAWWMLLGYLVISLSVSWVFYLGGALTYVGAPIFGGYYGEKFLYFCTAATFLPEFAAIASIAYLAGTDAGIKLIHRLGPRLSIFFITLAFIVVLVLTRVPGPLLLTAGFSTNNNHPGAIAAGHTAVPVTQGYIGIVHSAGIPIAIAATLLWLSYRNRKRTVVVE